MNSWGRESKHSFLIGDVLMKAVVQGWEGEHGQVKKLRLL